jgi:hypothetical protein
LDEAVPPPPETPYLRPALLTAVVAAAFSVAVATVFVLLARGSADIAPLSLVRTATRTWLVSLGSGLQTGAVSWDLVPVGAVLLAVGAVTFASSWVVRTMPDDVAAYAATTAGTYGVLAGIASAASDSGDVGTSVWRAAFGAFVVGGLGALLTVARRHDASARLWPDRPEVRSVLRAATVGVAAVLGAATVVTLVLLVRHLERAADLWALLDPGAGGGLALGLACVLAVPTLVLWATSALLGPGFALGTDTSVDLTGAHLGEVPALPVLAALPAPGEFPGWVFVLALVPLAAGMLAGWRLDPGEREELAWQVGLAAAAGGVAGLVLGVLVGLSGGSMGPGRMADAGPPMLTPLLVAVPVMAVGGALGGVLSHYRGRRALSPPDARAPGRARLWRRHQPPGPDRRDLES